MAVRQTLKMGAIRVLVVSLVSWALLPAVQSLSLTDPNTCTIKETFMTTKNVTVKQPISVKSYEWCLRVPPRCTIYRTEWRSATETQAIPMTRTAVGCCPGYRLSSQDTCTPICTNGCFSGTCIAPEICTIKPTPTSPFVTPKPLRDKSDTSSSTTRAPPILEDNDLQIEDSLITVTKQDSVRKNVSAKTTPSYEPVVTSTDHSPVIMRQAYNLSISTTVSYITALGNSVPKTSTSPISSLARPVKEKGSGDVGNRQHIGNKTVDPATVKEEAPRTTERTNQQGDPGQTSVIKELDMTRTIGMTDTKNEVTARPTQGHANVLSSPNNDTFRRDPLKYTTSLENHRTDNDTTFTKAQQMNLSDRFVYSIGISVGVMFAIIMVTLVITKHQHYLQGVDPRCGNTQNSKKCKAAHQNEEQETTLHVLRYQVTREVTNQPLADRETTCINSTRNSTITVYNFPPPVNAFDVPLRPPARPFGDYDFPSPMAENVYDEIPAHRDAGEGHRCFVRQ